MMVHPLNLPELVSWTLLYTDRYWRLVKTVTQPFSLKAAQSCRRGVFLLDLVLLETHLNLNAGLLAGLTSQAQQRWPVGISLILTFTQLQLLCPLPSGL